jgi:glycosyltransferase involved in cell wall biosynthesis
MQGKQKSLRLLAVVDLPWNPKLGAARVWIELTQEWGKAGHVVEKFCLTDAFPVPASSSGLSTLRQLWFPYRAAKFIRSNADRFDVIDCLVGTLPFSKKSLRFHGLLVARSVGLFRLYDRFSRSARQRWPKLPKGRIRGRLFYTLVAWRLRKNAEKAIRQCDLINLPNADELGELAQGPPSPKLAIVQPYGLNERERDALARASLPPATRLQKKTVSFIGAWNVRKGAKDWGEIIRRIAEKIPEAQFLFLGTMSDEGKIFEDLGEMVSRQVRSVSTYDPADLPQLLAECAVGLFPSYIEGFGIAVLEQLACGIPTIAYDVPGPRSILEEKPMLLTPRGDATAIADKAVAILRMNPHDYADLALQCRALAAKFRWDQIAAATLEEYRAALLKLRT